MHRIRISFSAQKPGFRLGVWFGADGEVTDKGWWRLKTGGEGSGSRKGRVRPKLRGKNGWEWEWMRVGMDGTSRICGGNDWKRRLFLFAFPYLSLVYICWMVGVAFSIGKCGSCDLRVRLQQETVNEHSVVENYYGQCVDFFLLVKWCSPFCSAESCQSNAPLLFK